MPDESQELIFGKIGRHYSIRPGPPNQRGAKKMAGQVEKIVRVRSLCATLRPMLSVITITHHFLHRGRRIRTTVMGHPTGCAIRMAVGLLAMTWAQSSPAAKPGGELFPPTAEAGPHRLELRGQVLYRYLRIWPVYRAALYLPPGVQSSQTLEAVPKRLEIIYARSFRADTLVLSANKILREIHSPEELAAMEPQLTAINALYREVARGDRYALTYWPGQGTELSRNGQAVGIVPGDDFARRYFAIWLGPHPLAKPLREHLLAP